MGECLNKLCNIGIVKSYTTVKKNTEDLGGLIRSDFYDILPNRKKIKVQKVTFRMTEYGLSECASP